MEDEPLPFANGGEALLGLKDAGGKVDLLMRDVVMPGINGLALARELQTIIPGIKVLFTSGYTDDIIASHGVLEENLQFLSKPYTQQSLAWKIREVLDG